MQLYTTHLRTQVTVSRNLYLFLICFCIHAIFEECLEQTLCCIRCSPRFHVKHSCISLSFNQVKVLDYVCLDSIHSSTLNTAINIRLYKSSSVVMSLRNASWRKQVCAVGESSISLKYDIMIVIHIKFLESSLFALFL